MSTKYPEVHGIEFYINYISDIAFNQIDFKSFLISYSYTKKTATLNLESNC